MHLSCLIGRHSVLPSNVRNLGLRVSQCRCCGRDMIHRQGRWTTVPSGFRIVWRRLDEVMAEAVPLKLTRNLPVLSRDGAGAALSRRIAELIDLAGTTVAMVGWTIADHCRALAEALQGPRRPQQLVLPLYVPKQSIRTRFGSFAARPFSSMV